MLEKQLLTQHSKISKLNSKSVIENSFDGSSFLLESEAPLHESSIIIHNPKEILNTPKNKKKLVEFLADPNLT